MGPLRLKGTRERYTGFLDEGDAVFFFRDGVELCYWDRRSDYDADIQIQKARALYEKYGLGALEIYLG